MNWFGQYLQVDGYGRFNYRMVSALQELGVGVRSATLCHIDMPRQMQWREGIDWGSLSITCAPPFSFKPLPGKQWVYTMTEGSLIPPEWVEKIEKANVERVIVPCKHNLEAFRNSGVTVPISVIPGGVDPAEFPLMSRKESYRPYTFLTFADRGSRKGWEEVWEAFYAAFGGKTSGIQDVRLVVKSRLGSPSPIPFMSDAIGADRRVSFQMLDSEEMQPVYSQADCLVLPSRSEGWGMIHREAACMGLPVITQKYSGLDDGYTENWAVVVNGGKVKPIPREVANCLGDWMIADIDHLAQAMTWAYHSPEMAAAQGVGAAAWLRENQTWTHAAVQLHSLVKEYGYG